MRNIATIIANSAVEGIDAHAVESIEYHSTHSNRYAFIIGGVVSAFVKFNFSAMSVDISNILVAEAEREQGICTQFVQNLYLASQAEGFSKIELTASKDGRFVWAALGFHPTLMSWTSVHRHIMEKLKQAENRGAAQLIRNIIERNAPELFPSLADLPGDRSDVLSPAGMVCSILMSGPVWQAELEIGDPAGEQYLFGEGR